MFIRKWAFGAIAVIVLFVAQCAMATDFTITTNQDFPDTNPGDGTCTTIIGQCSLRAAIQESNALSGSDNIYDNLTTVQLTIAGNDDNAATGDLDITSDITLRTILGSPTIDAANVDRLFDVLPGGTLRLEKMHMVNGLSDTGGLIRNSGVLVIDDSVLNLNVADGLIASSTTPGRGGAIANLGGIVRITDSTFSNNTATGVVESNGGAIFNLHGRIFIQSSLIVTNKAGLGGGIYSIGGLVSARNTTIQSNDATVFGGGIAADSFGTIDLNNVSISGNTAESHEPTISGGGIYNSGFSRIVMSNTILGENHDNGPGPDCSGTIDSRGHNLVQSLTGCTIIGNTTGNITGQSPNLHGSSVHGGPTQTPEFNAFLDSPAIDAGDNATCERTDQRGVPRPQGPNNTCDIGSVEVITAESIDTPFIVNDGIDAVDANIGDGICATASGQCSLRAAIQEANFATSGPKVILIPEGTIPLTIPGTGEQASATGDLDLTDPDTFILGSGKDNTFISGNQIDRVFHNFSTSTIVAATIMNGFNNGTGGGNIFNQGTLTLSHCDVANGFINSPVAVGGAGITNQGGTLNLIGTTLAANHLTIPAANYGGGAIDNFSFGTVNLEGCMLISNSSSAFAGGIFNNSGTLNLTNTTVSNNISISGGSGITARGTVNLNNSTVAFNDTEGASGAGGGIFNFDGTVTLHNSILGPNNSEGIGPDCSGAAITLQGFNLVEDTSNCTLTGQSATDFLDVPSFVILPGFNGGGILSNLPQTGTAVFQHGDNATCAPTDGRGVPRPQGVTCDMGAVEFDQYKFVDTFEDGDASDWFHSKGTWSVSSGSLTGSSVKKADNFSTAPPCSNCTIETNVSIQSLAGRVTLFGWYLDKKNYIEIDMLKSKKKWRVKQKSHGHVVSKGSFIQPIVQGQNYHLTIRRTDTEIVLFIDGTQAIVIPSKATSTGSFAVRIQGNKGLAGIVSLADVIVY